MSGIFGVANFRDGLVDGGLADIRRMAAVMAEWGIDGIRCGTLATASFGQAVTFDTPEARAEQLPLTDSEQAVLFTAEGRIDNREEVADRLRLPASVRRDAADGDLMFEAYRTWGESCADYLVGDWSFAAWHARERTLQLCRDQSGNTSVYYAHVGSRAAFASDIRSILQLPWVPRDLDEFWLAKSLINWHRGRSGSSVYAHIQSLAPGHAARVSDSGSTLSQYWRPSDSTTTILPRDEEYAEALRETLRTAVKCRLRSHRPVGSTLSAGLDSGGVTALAAAEYERTSARLIAFTVVPAVEGFPQRSVGRLLNEAEGARRVAVRYPAIEHVVLDYRALSPIQALRKRQAANPRPHEAARNAAFVLTLLQAAGQSGLGVLLTGHVGNLAMSFEPERSIAELVRGGHLRTALSRVHLLKVLVRTGGDPRRLLDPPWCRYWPINPEFAREFGLYARLRAEGYESLLRARKALPRADHLLNFISKAGIWNEEGAGFGLDIRDPSADRRVLELALSVPLRLWRGRLSRSLFREAMRGILPEEIRLNTDRGLQSPDTCERLAQRPDELRQVFEEVEASTLARRYVDLPYCRHLAANLQAPDRVGPLGALDMLLHGLGVSLFLAALERGEPKLLPLSA